MHGGIDFESLLIMLALSVGVVALFHRIKLPSIAGFIVVGVLVGPHGLSLVADSHEVERLAEFGVVLLLFSIGLEFSIGRLRKIWKLLLEGGTPYVLFAGLASYLVAVALGLPRTGAIYVGFWISLSSTAIVLKALAARGEIDSPHGRLVIAILLFQDLCIVPMMLLLPLLAGVVPDLTSGLAEILAESLLIIVVVLLVSRYVVPPLLSYVAHTRNRELFLLMTLLLCLGTAGVANRLGLSAALGAFLGGLLLSKSEYGIQALSDILPFRDFFNSIFFMSIGMLLDIGFFSAHPIEVSLVAIAILLGKTLIGFLIAKAIGFPARVAALAAVALAQVGEFSFILARTGQELQLIHEQTFQLLLAASIITMAVTPIAIAFAPRMAAQTAWIERLAPLRPRRSLKEESDEGLKLTGHVVVAGYGLNGRNLVRVLSVEKIPFLIVDLNARTVQESRRAGLPIVYGDVSTETTVRHLGLDRAKMIVLSISDPDANRRAVRLLRDLYPDLHILVRTRYMSEVEDLRAMGIEDVVPEEFETSIEISARVLASFGTPIAEIRRHLESVRSDGYRSLRLPEVYPDEETIVRGLGDAIQTESFKLLRASPIVGLSLIELGLRARTGATILAVMRDDETLANPNPALTLKTEDIVVLVGSQDQIAAARSVLSGEIDTPELA